MEAGVVMAPTRNSPVLLWTRKMGTVVASARADGRDWVKMNWKTADDRRTSLSEERRDGSQLQNQGFVRRRCLCGKYSVKAVTLAECPLWYLLYIEASVLVSSFLSMPRFYLSIFLSS